MSIALRMWPSRLELKKWDGSGRLAPRANVSFTAFVYVSPVQTIPLCDQTGIPAIAFDGFLHFRSSIIPGSASRISARMRARVFSRQSSGSRWSISRAAVFPAACSSLRIRPRAVPSMGRDSDSETGLRGLLVRDLLLVFGLAIGGHEHGIQRRFHNDGSFRCRFMITAPRTTHPY